jgi:hypothetical protein
MQYWDGSFVKANWHGNFVNALADIKSTCDITLQIGRDEVIQTTTISPSNIALSFINGAILSDDANNADLTINGPILAAQGQTLFDWGNGSGTLTTVFLNVMHNTRFYIVPPAVGGVVAHSSATYGYNSDVFPTSPDIGKGTQEGNISLASTGNFIKFHSEGFRGTPVGILSCEITKNTTGTDIVAEAHISAGDIIITLHISGVSETPLDLTTVVATGGGNIGVSITYLTDA